MEKLKCEKCGLELDYVDLRLADSDIKNGELYLEELWECSDCEKQVVVEITGKITKIDKWEK